MLAETRPVILLEGDGVAAVCLARLMADADVPLLWQPNARPKLAAILLGEQTQHLLRELFPASEEHPTDLFAGFTPLKRRIVLWGDAPEALELPHNGVIAPEEELLRRLWERVPTMEPYEPSSDEPISWRIQTSRADASSRSEQTFGSRHASFSLVEFLPGAAQEACWVESVVSGWLFLLSLGGGRATLIAVGKDTQALLSESRLVAAQISHVVSSNGSIPAFPRMTDTLAAAGIICCGSAAMSFDPLCGEGVGNAVREAFLAAAVVRAELQGASPKTVADHYAERLQRGFLRHLQVCLQFYASGGKGAFWQSEEHSLREGTQKLQGLIGHEQKALFRLVDRDLLSTQAIDGAR